MIKVKNGGEITRGDIIAVACNNYISVGIYLGRGQGGTVQYLWPGSASSSKNWHGVQLVEWKGDKPMRPLTISQMGYEIKQRKHYRPRNNRKTSRRQRSS